MAAVSVVALAASVDRARAADAAPDNEIVVTGTLIRGIAPVGAPVVSLNPQEIAKTGMLDTADVLKTVPQISTLGISDSTTGTTANGNGTNTTAGTGVNIRGLGQQATLTLINGHRGAPGGQFGNYFEPSNVPVIALGGIEILTDGASAIYGSDAMAGVVNLILRKNFNGAEANATYSYADGYHAYDISGVVGRTWDTGSFMVAGEHYYHTDLLGSSRPNLFVADGPSVFQGNGAVPRGYTNFSFNPNIRTGSGASTVYYAGPAGGTSLAQFTPNAQNIVGAWYDTTALPEQTRDSFVSTFDQKLNDRVTIYGQGFYSERKWVYFGGVSGATLGVNSTLTVPSNNPYFISGVPGATTSETVLLSQFSNLGPLVFDGSERSWQAVVGFTAKLWGDWQLDASVQNAGDRVRRIRYNTVNTCGLTGGAASACTLPAGEIASPTGAPLGAIGQTNPAYAFNSFGANNALVLGQIRATDLQQSHYDSNIVTAKIDGSLFKIPGGEVRTALGAEYRGDTEGQFNTTESTAANSSQSINIATQKSMTVWSAFAEVVVPLIGEANATPWAKKLELSLAGRYSDYNILTSKTTNPKIGLTWQPVDDLQINASYSTSFRVNLASTDPNNAPLLRIRSISDYLAVGGAANAIQRGGGNPDLQPETSDTWTFGGDYRPSQIKGLDLSLTYFNVRYNGVIDTPGAAVLNGVTAGSQAIYAPYITRRPSTVTPGADDTAFNAQVAALEASPLFTGAVIAPVNLIIDARSVNAGVIQTDGFDFKAAYRWNTSFGAFDAALLGEYFLNYDRSLTPTGALVSRVGQIDFPQRYRLRAELGWNRDGFGVNLFGNYTPSYSNTYVTPAAPVSAYFTVDLGLSYDTGDRPSLHELRNIVVSLNVENLFDTRPPYVAEFNQNFDSSVASMLQRVVSLQVAKKF